MTTESRPHPLDEDESSSKSCKKCSLTVNKGHAYKLGDDRWHINCFVCAKCSKKLGVNSDFLVLGDGALICSECSYDCNNCGKKIDDLAILTGDQAYCPSCFRCRSCKKRIEDLRYARTSRGLFCMACHEKLVERKKRHDRLKKDKEKEKKPPKSSIPAHVSTDIPVETSDNGRSSPNNLTPHRSTDSSTNSSANRSSSYSTIEKSLPDVPPKNDAYITRSSVSPVEEMPKEFNNTVEASVSTGALEHDESGMSIEEVDLYDDSDSGNEPLLPRNVKKPNTLKQQLVSETFQENTSSNEEIMLDLSMSNGPSRDTTPLISTPPILAPPPYLNKGNLTPKDSYSDKSEHLSILYPNGEDGVSQALSPGRVKGTKSESDQLTLLPDDDDDDETYEEANSRHGARSPYANINRKVIVMETPRLGSNEHGEEHNFTPKSLSSPPKVPLPEFPTPNSPNRGLNIQGIDYQGNQIPVATPQKNKFFSFGSAGKKEDADDLTKSLTRSKSILSPKFSLNRHKHQRSISGSKFSISSPPMNGEEKSHINVNNISAPISKSGTIKSFHSRGHSDSSHVAAFTTPPLPSVSHNRSTSDASFEGANMNYYSKIDLELRNIKTEIYNLNVNKGNLREETHKLLMSKDSLLKELESLTLEIGDSRELLAGLKNEISALDNEQQQLLETNKELQKQNALLSSENERVTNVASQNNNHSAATSLASHPSITEIVASVTPITIIESHEAPSETQKAKPRFWRRAKIGNPVNNLGVNGNGAKGMSSSQSSFSIASSLHEGAANNGSNTSTDSSHSSADTKKGGALSSFMSKSRSTNLLDSMLNTNGGGSDNSSSGRGNNNLSAYTNPFAGRPSKEIIIPLFGSSLELRARFEGSDVPLIITKCLKTVEEKGLDMEGIYRISGGNSHVEKIEKAFAALNSDTDEKQMKVIEDLIDGDIHSVTSAVKRYLRKLQDPLIAMNCYDSYIQASSKNHDNLEHKLRDLTKVVGKLPETNRKTLFLLATHINEVAALEDINRMTLKNLAVVFAPTLARDETGEREIIDMQARNDSTETLFRHYKVIFKDFS